MEIGQTTWKFTSGGTRKFSVHSSSFPSVVQHHGMSPRVSLSLHYPKSLGPRSCCTCQRSQRASSTQCVAAQKRQKKLSPGEGLSCANSVRCPLQDTISWPPCQHYISPACVSQRRRFGPQTCGYVPARTARMGFFVRGFSGVYAVDLAAGCVTAPQFRNVAGC